MEDDPVYDVSVGHANGDAADGEACLRAAVESTLRRHHCPRARLAVVLVDDARMTELNRAHLEHDGPTDVLTFDLIDEPSQPGIDGVAVDGDIIISLETATRQADQRGHAPEVEAALYAVHGTLHLLGYDDKTSDGAATMHKMENSILSEVGLGNVYGVET